MKVLSFLILLTTLLGCNKSEDDLSAQRFMELVIADAYNKLYLPDLEPSDISDLLKYRNDKTLLSSPPVNPISSFLPDSVTAGIIALWTIESIRITELKGDDSEFERFPSLNPVVRDATGLIKDRFVIQDGVATRYYNWWFQGDLSETEKLKIDPLMGTNFSWQ